MRVEGNAVRIPQGPGWVFGDVALLFNSPRTASVVAASDVVLWALDRVTFLRFVMKHAQGAHKLRFVRKVSHLLPALLAPSPTAYSACACPVCTVGTHATKQGLYCPPLRTHLLRIQGKAVHVTHFQRQLLCSRGGFLWLCVCRSPCSRVFQTMTCCVWLAACLSGCMRTAMP